MENVNGIPSVRARKADGRNEKHKMRIFFLIERVKKESGVKTSDSFLL